jgi:hypothetical protein
MAAPEREATFGTFFGAVIFAPIVETFLLTVGIRIIKSFSSSVVRIGIASAVVWGCLHALFGFMWFFGVVWSFFVWSCGYMAWQSVSERHAFAAAAIPHASLNAIMMLILFLEQV